MFGRNISSWLSDSGVLEDWEVMLVAGVVHSFCRPGKGFLPGDFEDVFQECLLRWVEARQKPMRDRRAFLQTVVRNKLRELLSARRTDKRRILDEADSLDRPIGRGGDSELTLGDTVSGESQPPTANIDLQVELSRVVRGLSDRQRQIAEMLASGQPVTAISEALGLHRSTIHDEIQRIRRIFASAGLRDYLG